MNFDLLHTLVTTGLVLVAIFGIEHSGITKGKNTMHRAVVIGLVLFVLVAVLNVVWPYHSN